MTQKSKRAWSSPELIVLVRGKPEESVLAGCKNAAGAATEKGSQNDCFSPPQTTCGVPCQDVFSS